MSIAALRRKPGHLIRRAQQVAVGLFAEECDAHGVTPIQYAALAAIAAASELDATALSARIDIDRSTLSDVLERLVARGLVERRASARDRRVKHLRLSRAGHDRLAAVEPAVRRAQKRILAPLAPDERREFMRLLERLIAPRDGTGERRRP